MLEADTARSPPEMEFRIDPDATLSSSGATIPRNVVIKSDPALLREELSTYAATASLVPKYLASPPNSSSENFLRDIDLDVLRALLRRLLQLDGAIDSFYRIVGDRWKNFVRPDGAVDADFEPESAEEVVECILMDSEDAEAAEVEIEEGDGASFGEAEGARSLPRKVSGVSVAVESSDYEEMVRTVRHENGLPLDCLLYPFSILSLREFLGYASSPSRNRIYEVILDRSRRASTYLQKWRRMEDARFVPPGSADHAIFHTLFGSDNRSLRAAGGFSADGSLLPDALSIGRLRARALSWERFAANGGRLPKRVRRADARKKMGMRGAWVAGDLYSRALRKRSCSVNPSDPVLSSSLRSGRKRTRTVSDLGMPPEPLAGMYLLPEFVEITLARRRGEDWGITLAAEGGDMCVVNKHEERGPKDLMVGDIITMIVGGRTEVAVKAGDELGGLFEKMICVFRTNDVVHVVLKRVTS